MAWCVGRYKRVANLAEEDPATEYTSRYIIPLHIPLYCLNTKEKKRIFKKANQATEMQILVCLGRVIPTSRGGVRGDRLKTGSAPGGRQLH